MWMASLRWSTGKLPAVNVKNQCLKTTSVKRLLIAGSYATSLALMYPLPGSWLPPGRGPPQEVFMDQYTLNEYEVEFELRCNAFQELAAVERECHES